MGKYKLSQFLICTQIKSEHILFSTFSGKSILLNKENYKHFVNLDLEYLDNTLLSKLKEYQILVPIEKDETAEVIDNNKEKIKETTTLYQTIMPTSSCQLGCFYCGQEHSGIKMSNDTMKNVLKEIETKLIANKNYEHIQVGWFGAEPLLAINQIISLTNKIIELCVKYNTTYSAQMPTNGMLLTQSNLKILSDCYVSTLDVTLDGLKETHDNSRYTKGKKGSFDKIVSNLKSLLELENFDSYDCEVTIRVNVHKDNFNDVIPLFDYLNELGFFPKYSFYLAPVHSWGNDAHKQQEDMIKFSELEMIIIQKLIEIGVEPAIIPDRNYEVCAVVNENSNIIDPTGNVYSCTEIPLVPSYNQSEFIIGNVNNNATKRVKNRPFGNWNDLIKSRKSQSGCHDCHVLPICGGACPKSWAEGISPCPSFKFNIEERVALAYGQIKT